MRAAYKILFQIDLEHDYYSDLQCKDFSVIPSEETEKLLKANQLLIKTLGSRLVALIKVKTQGTDKNKPLFAINPTDKFLFYLVLNNPRFAIITNLDDDKFMQGHRFYFTNVYENDLDTKVNLTSPIKLTGGSANYKPGDSTADGAGIVYECIRNVTGANPPPDTSFWYNRGKQQYVS